MEKIQAAIAKARAARDTGPRPETARRPDPAPSAAVQELSDHETHQSREAAWLALPAYMPKPSHVRRHRLLAYEAGSDAMPFDVIRTRMLQQMRKHDWKRVAITSPGPGCGKSVLALNLAFGLARQAEQRTLLIEADFRRPSFARTLGLTEQHEISQVFEGRAPFSDHAVRHGANLAIASQTTPQKAPAELLQSRAAAEALEQVEATYAPTVMLFDMPPMQAGDDVMSFAGQLDAVLIVAAAEATTVKQVDQCERELAAQVNVMGVVLNKCRYAEEEANYGYY